jgi:hypothetical protein
MIDRTYEQGFEDGLEEGVEEGIAIERARILNLIDDYISNPDIDLAMLIEFIELYDD